MSCVEPWGLEPLCHVLEPFNKSGTFMWNLGEPGARFPAAPRNHPEALLEEPQAFQAVGEKKKRPGGFRW